MRHILIATHGNFAKGILSSISIISGIQENISTINAYTESKNIDEALKIYFENKNKSDEIIVLTDIFGGSVNQAVIKYMNEKNIFLITGFNLALLLEIITLDSEKNISEEILNKIIENSKQQLIYVNSLLKNKLEDDFE